MDKFLWKRVSIWLYWDRLHAEVPVSYLFQVSHRYSEFCIASWSSLVVVFLLTMLTFNNSGSKIFGPTCQWFHRILWYFRGLCVTTVCDIPFPVCMVHFNCYKWVYFVYFTFIIYLLYVLIVDPFSVYTDEQVWESLAAVNLRETIQRQPYGLNTQMAEFGSNMRCGVRTCP